MIPDVIRVYMNFWIQGGAGSPNPFPVPDWFDASCEHQDMTREEFLSRLQELMLWQIPAKKRGKQQHIYIRIDPIDEGNVVLWVDNGKFHYR